MNRREWGKYLKLAQWERHACNDFQRAWLRRAIAEHGAAMLDWEEWKDWEQLWPALAMLAIAALAYVSKLLDYLLMPGEWK